MIKIALYGFGRIGKLALRRLFGTILSGLTYQASGLWLCLATSGFMLVISGMGAKNLK